MLGHTQMQFLMLFQAYIFHQMYIKLNTKHSY